MTFVDDAIKSHDVCVNSYFFINMKKWNQVEIYILLNCRYFEPLKFIMLRGLWFFYVYENFGRAEMLKVQIMCKNIRNVQSIVLFTIHGAENNLRNFNLFNHIRKNTNVHKFL